MPALPSPSAPARLTDRKRQDILGAAAAAFRAQGFEAASMDRIAAEAGVSKRTVYNHFPSKDALFEEILHQLWTKSLAQIDQAYEPGTPLRDQLRALLLQKMAMLHDPAFMDLARVLFVELMRAPERAASMMARLTGREEGLTTWIRAAAADGRLKEVDPLFASQQLQGLVKGFAFWPQISLGQPPLPRKMQKRVVDSAVDLFLGHYASPPPRRAR